MLNRLQERLSSALSHEFLIQSGGVFATTLFLQIITFLFIAILAQLLSPPDFATFSILISIAMIATSGLDFGMNIMSTKMFSATGRIDYIIYAHTVRIYVFFIAIIICFIIYMTNYPDVAMGVLAGSLLNIWYGNRTADQAQGLYKKYIVGSVVFGLLRVISGTLSIIIFNDVFLIFLAIYAIPPLVVFFSKSKYRLMPLGRCMDFMFETRRYALHVYLNSLVVSWSMYLPIYFANSVLTATAVGSFSLIITFLGPLFLISTSVWSTLLPRVCDPTSGYEQWIWSKRGVICLFLIWILGFFVAYFLGEILLFLYGEKYPQIGPSFFIAFNGTSLSLVLGIFCLSVHARGVPQISTYVSGGRWVLSVLLFYFFTRTLTSLICIWVVCSVLSQVVIIIYLYIIYFRRRDFTHLIS